MNRTTPITNMMNNRCRNESRGFSLIEVMIALVVLSVGLLGIAGLQVSGMRFTFASNAQTQAAMLAQDMIDRMRANQQGVRDGDYDGLTASPSSTVDCTSQTCTTAQMAQMDAFDWYALLGRSSTGVGGSGLPMGTGSVTCINPSGVTACGDQVNVDQATYQITVCWAKNGVAPATGCSSVEDGYYYTTTFFPLVPYE